MSHVWLSHHGDYEDYTVDAVYASVESWWAVCSDAFLKVCPSVVIEEAFRHEGHVKFRPACRCPMVRVERYTNWPKGHHYAMARPHGFGDVGLYRSEVVGSIPVITRGQCNQTTATWWHCSRCGLTEGRPHDEDCWFLTHFPEPMPPLLCTWRKAGIGCSKEAVEGDDQFCPAHLEIVHSARRVAAQRCSCGSVEENNGECYQHCSCESHRYQCCFCSCTYQPPAYRP